MKFFFGLLIGLLAAIGIAVGAALLAFGDLGDIGERDKSADITETYDYNGFDKINIAGVYELNARVGPNFSVTISGPEQELSEIKISVEGGVLQLDQKDRDERVRGKRRWRNRGVTADITIPALASIVISGVVEGDITGVDAGAFNIEFSGVGELDVSGSCETLTASFSGVGELDARSLECNRVNVDLSGVGEAEVYASEAVVADISGIGMIMVYGSPAQIEKSSGMMSTVSIE